LLIQKYVIKIITIEFVISSFMLYNITLVNFVEAFIHNRNQAK